MNWQKAAWLDLQGMEVRGVPCDLKSELHPKDDPYWQDSENTMGPVMFGGFGLPVKNNEKLVVEHPPVSQKFYVEARRWYDFVWSSLTTRLKQVNSWQYFFVKPKEQKYRSCWRYAYITYKRTWVLTSLQHWSSGTMPLVLLNICLRNAGEQVHESLSIAK